MLFRCVEVTFLPVLFSKAILAFLVILPPILPATLFIPVALLVSAT